MPARAGIAVVAVAAVAAGAVLLPIARPGFPLISFDIYAYFYINILHALRALHSGGAGLLWNPWQSCGQPFLANPLTALFYPPHWLFIPFGAEIGLRVVTVVNLIIGGLGAFALARQLRLTLAAALAGAFAFMLGNTSLHMSSWSPMHGGPYAWLPVALFFAERLLAQASTPRIVGLGCVLTLALLNGFPQMLVLIYILVGLRLLWALAMGECDYPLRIVTAFTIALCLPLLLGAVQLLPSIELASASVRSASLGASAHGQGISWSSLYTKLAHRNNNYNPFLPTTLVLVSAALAVPPRQRRLVAFYGLTAALCLSLAFGRGSPFFALFAELHLDRVLRHPARFVWATDFCLSVLAAFGVDALTAAARDRRQRAAAVAAIAAPLVLLWLYMPGGLTQREILALSPVAVALAALRMARLAPLTAPTLAAMVVLGAVVAPFGPVFLWLPSDSPLFARAEELTPLRSGMTAQDRVALLTTRGDYGFTQKTATVLKMRSIYDYEPLLSQHYGDYFAMMRRGNPNATMADVYFVRLNWFPAGASRPMLNLTATRYLLAESEAIASVFSDPPLRPLDRSEVVSDRRTPLHIYENETALPRAFYVPRIEVIENGAQMLDRLAHGLEDPRAVAYVDATPPSGFVGDAAPGGAASVAFATDEPEHLALHVQAPRRGFLFLADQFYPGWRAWVNGSSAPILRANYAFRLIEVPAGASEVELRFRPSSLIAGAAVSLTTALALSGIALHRRRASRSL